MRSLLIGVFLAVGLAIVLSGPPAPGQAGQSPASGGAATSETESGPAAQPPYDPRAIFAPLTLSEPVNRYRSANGAPGPDYWQNRADYIDRGAARAEDQDPVRRSSPSPTPTTVRTCSMCSGCSSTRTSIVGTSRASVGGARARTQFTDGDVLDKVEIETGGRVRRRQVPGQRHAPAGDVCRRP